MGKKKNLKIVFDEEDRRKYLSNQGNKYSKKEKHIYKEKLKIKEMKTLKRAHNKVVCIYII
jgi:hypothetical protein